MDYTSLFFVANILFCLAYMVHDMFWLRTIAIVAATSTLPYYYFKPAPLYTAMLWQGAFILINAVNLVLLILNRRQVLLTEEEKKLHALVFRSLTHREMRKLLSIAVWENAPAGHALIRRGERLDRLFLIYSGMADVTVDGREVARLRDGQFAGEMSLVTGQAASADVVARQPVRYLYWPLSSLRRMLRRHPQYRPVLQVIFGCDMAYKLTGDEAAALACQGALA